MGKLAVITTDKQGVQEDLYPITLPQGVIDDKDKRPLSKDLIKIKDKEHKPSDFSGLGRVYLEKNIKEGKNILTQEMINKSNSIYIIEYDFDLNGARIVIPKGCVLDFQGGSLSNGSIVGNNTAIKAELVKIFGLDINLSGNWNVSEAYPEWFDAKGDGTTNDTYSIQKTLDCFYICFLSRKTYRITQLIVKSHTQLIGKYYRRYGAYSVLSQVSSFDGHAIITSNDAYEGCLIKGLKIVGGNGNNYAIYLSDPECHIRNVIIDNYHGNGIMIGDRAWGTEIYDCKLYGNAAHAMSMETATKGINVDSQGGKHIISNVNIMQYGICLDISRCDGITLMNSNISECSSSTVGAGGYGIRIKDNVKAASIINNYIENFSTGIHLESPISVLIEGNYFNGLSVAGFGIRFNGKSRAVSIINNYIYIGYTGGYNIAITNNEQSKREIVILNNDLDVNKLFETSDILYYGRGVRLYQDLATIKTMPANILHIGQTAFATDLGYNVTWTGSKWVDATGADV